MDSQDHHQQPQPEAAANDSGSASICGKGGGPQQIGVPRPTSTRWTPTTEQIRILRDLYYNYGVRSPNAEQIQRISARLRQFGKIEGKNVFYWFQNHQARERQKKRLASDPTFHHTHGTGQMGSYRYGSVAMEKKFTVTRLDFIVYFTLFGFINVFLFSHALIPQECSLSASSSGGLAAERVGWARAPTSYCTSLGNIYHYGGNPPPMGRYPQEEGVEEDVEKEDGDDDVPEIETLPLFPMRDDEYTGGSFFGISPSPSPNPAVASIQDLGPAAAYYNKGMGGAWHGDMVLMEKPKASLELSLSSCSGKSPASF